MKTNTLIATSLLAVSQSHLVSGMAVAFHASFDTLSPILESGPLNPVGIYLNISFPSFYFTQPGPATGLIPQSAPNLAYGIGSASNPAAMTTSYPHSTVTSFALSSLYYGCITSSRPSGAAALPVGCNITATGYRAGSAAPAAVQEFAFSPDAGWAAPLALGTFDDAAAFQGLERVTYEQSPAAGTFLVVDSIVGTIVTA